MIELAAHAVLEISEGVVGWEGRGLSDVRLRDREIVLVLEDEIPPGDLTGGGIVARVVFDAGDTFATVTYGPWIEGLSMQRTIAVAFHRGELPARVEVTVHRDRWQMF